MGLGESSRQSWASVWVLSRVRARMGRAGPAFPALPQWCQHSFLRPCASHLPSHQLRSTA